MIDRYLEWAAVHSTLGASGSCPAQYDRTDVAIRCTLTFEFAHFAIAHMCACARVFLMRATCTVYICVSLSSLMPANIGPFLVGTCRKLRLIVFIVPVHMRVRTYACSCSCKSCAREWLTLGACACVFGACCNTCTNAYALTPFDRESKMGSGSISADQRINKDGVLKITIRFMVPLEMMVQVQVQVLVEVPQRWMPTHRAHTPLSSWTWTLIRQTMRVACLREGN
jgi:hypothetical protein